MLTILSMIFITFRPLTMDHFPWKNATWSRNFGHKIFLLPLFPEFFKFKMLEKNWTIGNYALRSRLPKIGKLEKLISWTRFTSVPCSMMLHSLHMAKFEILMAWTRAGYDKMNIQIFKKISLFKIVGTIFRYSNNRNWFFY